jgi:hypothetical protein
MAAKILVTGDVVLDHNIYAGQRSAPDSEAGVGMLHHARPGGAILTYRLLEEMRALTPEARNVRQLHATDLIFGIHEKTSKALHDWPKDFQTGAVWGSFEGPKKGGPRFWRVSDMLGYGPRETGGYPASPSRELNNAKPQVLVIDDGGLGFRLKSASHCWPSFLTAEERISELQWIILKMSRPLARGDLWKSLASHWRDRLIVLVSADNLRSEDVRVTRGLSWESTVNDLVEELHSNPAVSGLKSCRHLVITMRGDAALWLDAPANVPHEACRLVFDRERGEGEWEDRNLKNGNAFGFLSAVTASLAWSVKDAQCSDIIDLVPALRSGLSATRFLRDQGHGEVGKRDPDFPFKETASRLLSPTESYAAAGVQCSGGCCVPGKVSGSDHWTMLGRLAHSDVFKVPLYLLARRLALLGPGSIENVPCARFEKLLTMDRREIQGLRSLRQLMLGYKEAGPQKQPLSLAVFGAPGSGKSFGLKQIAVAVFGDKNPVLEFNLSQFKGAEDLIGAFHQVRDKVLAGFTPVVFWDEFDSRRYEWLQYFLAPMQDGAFQEGQLTHFIGKSIFIFAGGTSRDYKHFGPPEEPVPDEPESQGTARLDFIMAKGPDFKSRLAGFLNVLGPNQGQVYKGELAAKGLDPWQDDPTDLAFPVRRAILLRSFLGLVKDKDEDRENKLLDIDPGLLNALLKIDYYKNGARSMEKLVLQMKARGGLPLRRAHLPPDELLALYVDKVERFHALVQSSYQIMAQAEKLVGPIHNDWYNNLTPERLARGGSYCKPYDADDDELKAANIAAALRIPEVLALAGYELEKGLATQEEEAEVRGALERDIDLFAEAEHMGWDEQTRLDGWTPGENWDEEKKKHHLLIPYDRLPQYEKDKDRRTIRNYPEYARLADFKIVKCKQEDVGA